MLYSQNMAGSTFCRSDYNEELKWQLRSFNQIQRDKDVAARFCAAIFISCVTCGKDSSLEDVLSGRILMGGQVNDSNFVLEIDSVGLHHYSYFCEAGHFTDDVKLPPVTQVALNQLVQPISRLAK